MGEQGFHRLLLVAVQLCGKAGGYSGAGYPPVVYLGADPVLGQDGEAFLLEGPG